MIQAEPLFRRQRPRREHIRKVLRHLIGPALLNSLHNLLKHNAISIGSQMQAIRKQTSKLGILRQVPRPNQRLTFFPSNRRHERAPDVRNRQTKLCSNFARSLTVRPGVRVSPSRMGVPLHSVKPGQLVLVDGRRSDDHDAGILGLCEGVLDDVSEVLLVGLNGDMLLETGETGVVGAEPDSLVLFVSYEGCGEGVCLGMGTMSRTLARSGVGKHLGKALRAWRVLYPLWKSQWLLFICCFNPIIEERTLIHGSPRPDGGRRLQGISICLLKERIGH